MTRRPFDPSESGDLGPDMDATLADLDRYLADTAEFPSASFTDDVMQKVEREPIPRRGLLGAFIASISAPGGRGRMALLAATVAVAVLAVALGRLGEMLPSNVGTSPQPTVVISPTPPESPSVEPSPSPSPQQTRSPKASPSASPEASDEESPEPSDDSSGPGGGGDSDDNSGPGSTDDGSDSGSGSDSSGSGS